jgi:hypothetical protein
MRPKTPGHRGPNKFRKTETTRLCRAVLDAGLSISRVEYDPLNGKTVVFPGKPGDAPSDKADDPNPWDKVLNAEDQKRPA